MRILLIVLLVLLMLCSVGCDTELGHNHADHDPDGESIHNHTSEEHQMSEEAEQIDEQMETA
jgi:hypothetical protein